jgi:hypothetical protein
MAVITRIFVQPREPLVVGGVVEGVALAERGVLRTADSGRAPGWDSDQGFGLSPLPPHLRGRQLASQSMGHRPESSALGASAWPRSAVHRAFSYVQGLERVLIKGNVRGTCKNRSQGVVELKTISCSSVLLC